METKGEIEHFLSACFSNCIIMSSFDFMNAERLEWTQLVLS